MFFPFYFVKIEHVNQYAKELPQGWVLPLSNEYNQQLTNTQHPVAHLQSVSITLLIKQLSWSHNVILMQKVKDLKAQYWYRIQCLKRFELREDLLIGHSLSYKVFGSDNAELESVRIHHQYRIAIQQMQVLEETGKKYLK